MHVSLSYRRVTLLQLLCMAYHPALVSNYNMRVSMMIEFNSINQNSSAVVAMKGTNCIQLKTGKPLQHMLPHLAKCVTVAPEICERAQNSIAAQSRTLQIQNLNTSVSQFISPHLPHLNIPSMSLQTTSYLPLPPSQISTPELSPLNSPLLLSEPLSKHQRTSSLTTEWQVNHDWTPAL
jgi:hypothetical protein